MQNVDNNIRNGNILLGQERNSEVVRKTVVGHLNVKTNKPILVFFTTNISL